MSAITPAERRALEAIMRNGTIKSAAFATGKSRHTLVRQLASARARLGVGTTVEAVRAVFVDQPREAA